MRSNFLREGLDPRLGERRFWSSAMHGDRYCRDREPWGGFTNEQSCSCVGKCAYDREREKQVAEGEE